MRRTLIVIALAVLVASIVDVLARAKDAADCLERAKTYLILCVPGPEASEFVLIAAFAIAIAVLILREIRRLRR